MRLPTGAAAAKVASRVAMMMNFMFAAVLDEIEQLRTSNEVLYWSGVAKTNDECKNEWCE